MKIKDEKQQNHIAVFVCGFSVFQRPFDQKIVRWDSLIFFF